MARDLFDLFGSYNLTVIPLFIPAVVIWATLQPEVAPRGPRTTLKQKLESLSGLVETMVLFAMVTGGLFFGIFTPTEAGAIGAMGDDPMWFGVIIVLVTQIGVITPPVGVNVYVVSGVARTVPLEVIFKGVIPLLIALVVGVLLMIPFPQIALFLPGLMK